MACTIRKPWRAPMQVVLWQVRLPVALMALLVGASLALAGAEMQTILNNPLAEPFTLGVSSSAALGAALAIVLDWGIPGMDAGWLVPANAFVFALGTLLLLQLLAHWRGAHAQTLVLFGIAIGFAARSEEHTSELQSRPHLVCRLLL